MAYTQDEWYKKVSKFVPSWWFENAELTDNFTVAVFNAIAAVMQQIQQDSEDQFAETFVTESDAPFEDLIGEEVNILRNAGESNGAYADRIQDLFGVSDGTTLKTLVDGELNNGSSTFIENWAYGFWDDAFFCDDDASRLLTRTATYNWFTVIIPQQTGGNEGTIRANIVSVLEANKALGVTYDILYHSSSDTDSGD